MRVSSGEIVVASSHCAALGAGPPAANSTTPSGSFDRTDRLNSWLNRSSPNRRVVQPGEGIERGNSLQSFVVERIGPL